LLRAHVHERHHVEHAPARLTRMEERHDMRMLEVRRGRERSDSRGEIRLEYLERDALLIVRPVTLGAARLSAGRIRLCRGGSPHRGPARTHPVGRLASNRQFALP
jgi:hypothetical protein